MRILNRFFTLLTLFSSTALLSVNPVEKEYPFTSYILDTLAEGVLTGMIEGPENILPSLADKTISRFAYKQINNALGVT